MRDRNRDQLLRLSEDEQMYPHASRQLSRIAKSSGTGAGRGPSKPSAKASSLKVRLLRAYFFATTVEIVLVNINRIEAVPSSTGTRFSCHLVIGFFIPSQLRCDA
jgi:hypothetical protein